MVLPIAPKVSGPVPMGPAVTGPPVVLLPNPKTIQAGSTSPILALLFPVPLQATTLSVVSTATNVATVPSSVAAVADRAVVVEEGGLFMNNYIAMEAVRSLQTYPTCRLVGEGATARFNSIMVAQPGSELDVGSRVVLGAPGCSAEIISRAVTRGGNIVARGHLKGETGGIRAHLECHGLILEEGGAILAVPELEGHHPDVDMSHEAAVGKIAQQEVEYLMSRGLSEEEATAAIVRGFLNVKIEGLPPRLEQEMKRMMEMSRRKAL